MTLELSFTIVMYFIVQTTGLTFARGRMEPNQVPHSKGATRVQNVGPGVDLIKLLSVNLLTLFVG